MPLRTSFFNKTVFQKNLTRFAPVWMAYGLCWLLGMCMIYIDDGAEFWFASRMGEMIQYSALINLVYAPLVAMLIFGDLYNTRMCYALHAMPLRREGWFLSNVASGLLFSLIPTGVMALLSIPLLAGTCVHNGWLIGLLWFLAVNLEYLCFFGIAVFCAMCVGGRFALGAVYAAVNFGAFVVYWMIDRIYTPMLYGVVTPSKWVQYLTPVVTMVEQEYIGIDNYLDLRDLFAGRIDEMTANFWVREDYYDLLVWAAVGIVFLLAALVLYRYRRLESAGDAVAIRHFEPIFLVAAAVAGATAGVTGREIFFGYYHDNATIYVFLGCGLMVGWFVGKMLIERTTRVFRKENWLGLLALSAALCVSFFCTSIDILGLETWTPKPEDVRAATLGTNALDQIRLTNKQDIEKVIQLQKMALEDRIEESGTFPVTQKNGVEGVGLSREDANLVYVDGDKNRYECRYAAPVIIDYEMESGRTIQRVYYIWADRGEGDIVNEYLSRWEVVTGSMRTNGWGTDIFEESVHQNFVEMIFGGNRSLTRDQITPEVKDGFLAALKADCEARTMTQNAYFHDGHFLIPGENGERHYTSYIYVQIQREDGGYLYLEVYADSENLLSWMDEQGLLTWEVRPENISHG